MHMVENLLKYKFSKNYQNRHQNSLTKLLQKIKRCSFLLMYLWRKAAVWAAGRFNTFAGPFLGEK